MMLPMDGPTRGSLCEAFQRINGAAQIALPPRMDWTTDLLMSMYVELSKVREEIEEKLDEAKARLAELEPLVVAYFLEEGKQRETRRGRTVALVQEEWPKTVTEDLFLLAAPAGEDLSREAADRLKETGRQRLVEALQKDPSTEHLVKLTCNFQTLRSFLLRDCKRDPETMKIVVPEHLDGKLEVSEVARARVTKG